MVYIKGKTCQIPDGRSAHTPRQSAKGRRTTDVLMECYPCHMTLVMSLLRPLKSLAITGGLKALDVCFGDVNPVSDTY